VNTCKETFDIIAMDIFIDDTVPAAFEQNDFLSKLKQLLSPDGVLMYNRLAFSKKDKKDTQDFYENTFTNTFPNATYLDVDGNWMLFNRLDALRSV
jgi:spermidine synthase